MLALKLSDCVILSVGSQVTENKCDNVIQLHPKVFLGCLEYSPLSNPLFNALKQNLPPPGAGYTPTSVLEAADMVKNIINNYLDDCHTTYTLDEFFVVGALEVEKGFKIYTIVKEKGHRGRHSVVEVVQPMIIGGRFSRSVMEEYLKKNPFKPADMTEKDGVNFVLEGVKHGSTTRDIDSIGEIQMVVISFQNDSKNIKWRQKNPIHYTDGYHLFAYNSDFS